MKEDDFTNLPEFQRITRKFADYINHIDEWLKKNKHEEISSYLQSVYHWYHTPSKNDYIFHPYCTDLLVIVILAKVL